MVTGGDLTRRWDGEVEAEGIERRRSRARALLSCEMCVWRRGEDEREREWIGGKGRRERRPWMRTRGRDGIEW